MFVAVLAVPPGGQLDWDAADPNAADPDELLNLAEELNLNEDEVRELLRDAVEGVRTAVEDWHREATTLSFAGWTLLLTGGLSNGQTPTELFDEIMLLERTGLAAAIGFSWPENRS